MRDHFHPGGICRIIIACQCTSREWNDQAVDRYYFEREKYMKKISVIVYGVLVVLLVLQSAFFSVLMVQFSDSKTFRLLIGFIGIGLLIVMPVLGLAKFAVDKPDGNAHALRQILTVLVTLVMPWLPVFAAGWRYMAAALNVAAVPVAALSLSAAIGGSAINTIRISATNPDDAPWYLSALRWVLSAVFLLMSLNLFFPAFARLCVDVAPRLNLDASLPGALAVTDRLWNAIFKYIGNSYVWMLDFGISLWASIKFYRVFFSKEGI